MVRHAIDPSGPERRRSPFADSVDSPRRHPREDTVLEFDPLDEYPIHQVPLPMRYVGPSDRNFYDRCIYQGVDHEADAYFITGHGRVPEPRRDRRVRDRAPRRPAVGGARRRDRVPTTGCSQEVGPVPHRGDRAVPRRCASSATPTSTASASTSRTGPSTGRSPNRSTSAARATASCSTRRASPASARGRGELRVDGETIAVTPERFTATRDRSWGIRPVGEAGTAGPAATSSTACGGAGSRCASTTSRCTSSSRRTRAARATRTSRCACWPEATGTRAEQLGWPLPEIPYKSGTRNPTRASIELTGRDGKTLDARDRAAHRHPAQRRLRLRRRPRLDARPVEGRRLGRGLGVRLQRPRRHRAGARSRSSDHVARATFDGQEGWGIFEHGSIGPHAPSGFTDMMQVAP